MPSYSVISLPPSLYQSYAFGETEQNISPYLKNGTIVTSIMASI